MLIKEFLRRVRNCKVTAPIFVHDGEHYRHVAIVETIGQLVILHLQDEKLRKTEEGDLTQVPPL